MRSPIAIVVACQTLYVEDISPAAGSEFSVLRTDNAIGNFTKIPQRIAVRIKIDPGEPDLDRLGPGMSVEAHVDTNWPERTERGYEE
ncbi:multidrug resistance efflux pump [Rhizobium azooxidifex]|uniref:Multidrug resistance efflux pump n=1 Tax=Mycoplana azooxidifex TaxID=1636188 RepID=A0A7W6DIB9_9HYPH|nr:hypothetical protein [Mycoplana azooxidifex]MBB3979544.1 multidrug resistance efflux pump [Mycoplana azooxidifex]